MEQKHPDYIERIPDSLGKRWGEFFKKHPVEYKGLQKNEHWIDYANSFVFNYSAGHLQNKKFDYDDELYFTKRFDFAKTILKGNTLEYFIAANIYSASKQRGYQKKPNHCL